MTDNVAVRVIYNENQRPVRENSRRHLGRTQQVECTAKQTHVFPPPKSLWC